jgi:hypothetical protein
MGRWRLTKHRLPRTKTSEMKEIKVGFREVSI